MYIWAMYICICHAVTDRQIRRAVDQGACSLGDVQARLPVAGCCGRCEDSAREVIREQVQENRGAASKALGAHSPAFA